VIYPEFARRAKALGADFLINITNDGWFGKTNGPYQHANIARFRSAELGLPMARCSNTGFSVFFDAWGRDLGRTQLLDSTVIRRNLPLPHRSTFYARHGSFIEGALLAILGLWIATTLAFRLMRKPLNNS
jgi:apolipoprotein N-acyltransferase